MFRRMVLALQTRSWAQHLGQMLGITLLFMLALKFVRDPQLHAWLWRALPDLLILVFAAKELADAPVNWGRAREAYRSGAGWWRTAVEVFPVEIRGWFIVFARWQLGFLNALRRKSRGGVHGQGGFSFLTRGDYGMLMPMLVISSFADIPLGHLAIGLMSSADAHRTGLHILLIALHVLAFTSLIGDRFWLGSGRHEITGNALRIALGARASGDIPLADIVSANSLAKRPLRGRTSPRDVVISPLGRPNLALQLREGSAVRLQHRGALTPELQTVYLYVDRPAELMARLNARH